MNHINLKSYLVWLFISESFRIIVIFISIRIRLTSCHTFAAAVTLSSLITWTWTQTQTNREKLTCNSCNGLHTQSTSHLLPGCLMLAMALWPRASTGQRLLHFHFRQLSSFQFLKGFHHPRVIFREHETPKRCWASSCRSWNFLVMSHVSLVSLVESL